MRDAILYRGLLRRAAALAGGLTVAAGAAVLLAWWTGRENALSVIPGWPPVTANTAFMFVSCGLALALLAPEKPERTAVAAARGLALGSVLLSLLTAAEYALGRNLGIDQLLAPASPGPGVRFPGRPSPHTAAAFILIGSALTALDARLGRKRPAPALAGAAGVIAMVAILGHLFHSEAVYGASSVFPHNEMAVVTAAMILILSAGCMAARPDEGALGTLSSTRAGGIAARRMLAGLFAMGPLVVLLAIGARLDWYSDSTAGALIVFLGFFEAVAFVLRTAGHLNRLDEERSRSEEQLHGLIEQAPDGVFVADLEGRYTEVNEAGARMLGYERGELVGRTIVDIIPEEDLPRLRKSKESLLRGGSSTAEWRLRSKDGSYLPVEISAKILPDGRWQAFVRDVTERVQIQRLRDEVISMTSHELRNPLTMALVSANMLEDESDRLSGHGREVLAMLAKSIQRMARLVDDFLDVEKLESGGVKLRLERLELGPLLAETIAGISGAAEGRVALRSAEGLTVTGDRDRLIQVVINLVSNALKFSPTGAPVEVEAAERDGQVRVSVKDRGPGIPAEFQGRIFQRFARADKAKASGSGLGLYISRTIIEKHGGRIGFETKPGEGTTFFFELPTSGL